MKMDAWKSMLNSDPTEWLLEKDDPSVRYFTLTGIMDETENDAAVKAAKEEIMRKGLVPGIMSKMNDGGYWDDPGRFYSAKYTGTVWQLIILGELGADGHDERIRKACEFVLDRSQDRESGGFSASSSAISSVRSTTRSGGGLPSQVIPCLTGNMVWSLIRLGYLEDPRVRCGIDWIVKYQRFDDNTGDAPRGWPYDRYEMCWGRHSCHMGVVKSLKALTEIPPPKRSKEANSAIDQGVEYLLAHHIYRKSHDLSSTARPGWLRLEFPLMYQTDILEILGILVKLGCRDERMREAFDKLLSKQDSQGRWKLQNTFNGRFQVDIGQKGEPDKWITLNALKVIKQMYSSN